MGEVSRSWCEETSGVFLTAEDTPYGAGTLYGQASLHELDD